MMNTPNRTSMMAASTSTKLVRSIWKTAALMKSNIKRAPIIGKMSIILKRVVGLTGCLGCTMYSMSVSRGSMSYLSTLRGVIVIEHLHGKQMYITSSILPGPRWHCLRLAYTTQPAGTAKVAEVSIPVISKYHTQYHLLALL